MRLVSAQFELLVVWIIGSWGWLSNKCVLYDKKSNYWLSIHSSSCPHSNLTAVCWDLSDLKLNLSIVPSNYQALCLEIRSGSVMQSGALSRFSVLETIHIRGCLSTILPGTFKGLSHVKKLYLLCMEQCYNSSLLPNTFSDLTNLEELSIENYRLSVMAPDALGGIPLLKKLTVDSCTEELSDLLCRIVNMSQSLTALDFTSDGIVILRHPNCSDTNGAVLEFPYFYRLQEVFLNFPNAHRLEKRALKCFENISSLFLPDNDALQTQLLQSGISRLRHFVFNNNISFESVCETVFKLSIRQVHISDHKTENYSESAIRNCQGIEVLRLSICHSDNVRVNLIHYLKNLTDVSVLRYWDVKPECIELCDTHTQGPITWLKRLSLTLYMPSITSEQFSCLKNLEHLDLESSNINNISDFTFNGLGKLRILNLRDNNISQITKNTLFGLHNLETLTLELNPLVHIEAFAFIHLTSLKNVDLGDIHHPASQWEKRVTLNLTHIFGVFPPGLMYMNITSFFGCINIIIGSNSTPKLGLALQVRAKNVSFQDCWRPFFKSVVSLTAMTEHLLCGSHFAAKYFTSLEYFDFQSMLYAEFVDMTDLNTLVQLRYLKLMRVDLILQPGLAIMFRNLTKLESLNLISCRILTLEEELSRDLHSLVQLSIKVEEEFSMLETFPEPLTSLSYLLFYRPRLHCSCDNTWLDNWARGQGHIQVIIWHPNEADLTCKDETGIQNFARYSEANCSLDVGFVLFFCTSLGLLLFMLVTVLYQLAGDYLLAFCHILRGWMEEAVRRPNPRGRHCYDVFVSYSSRDERWVVEQLLPGLEQRGPPYLRLCLHSRDFQLGKDIVDNITDSLYSSRHTLCVVSRHYLRSNWCSLELRLATLRLLVEHRDILILVFLEDIPPRQLCAHHRLARLVKTRTYLDWPQEPALQSAFWDRLWIKLAPPEPDPRL
ncbi:toll-like receptor 13 [Oncorhynchus clarkii lewisi]|uniref:toll-like receptor 13 n=1 Tax=Oncorhynchus clarkii lewisi TaxID=490388 RepID=UPI0039B9BCA8